MCKCFDYTHDEDKSRSLTFRGVKLLCGLLVQQPMLLYAYIAFGQPVNKPVTAGWVLSFSILFGFCIRASARRSCPRPSLYVNHAIILTLR